MKTILTALALALALAALAGCSVRGDGGGEGAEASSPEAGAMDAAVAGAAEGELGDDAVAVAPEAAPLPRLGPRVIQNASLSLSVPPGEFQQTIDEARALAAGLGGFVVGSSASQGRAERLVSGTLVVRVPARSYADAMKRLAALGRVEAREESGQDVSQEFVDLEARVRHLRAVERQLLGLLDRADTVAAALQVQSHLNQTQLELEQAQGRLQYLEQQVSFATIALDVRERGAEVEADDESWGIVEAWRTAGRAFVAVVGWMFVAVAAAAPALVALAVLALLGRAALRRRIGRVWRPRLKSD